jgi:predicted nucleic-acid-binding protein
MLLEHDKLTLEHADAVADALENYERRPSKVSFSDCLVLELARKAGHVPLGTFDRELGKLDGAQRLES